MDDTQRTLGEYGAQIEAMQVDMRELKADVKSMMLTLSEAKGSWKTLMGVGAIAGAAGAALTKVASLLSSIPLR